LPFFSFTGVDNPTGICFACLKELRQESLYGQGGSYGKAGKENTEKQGNDGGARIEGGQDFA
jgi:hypothetical protein